MIKIWKTMVCMLLGHQARGPVQDHPVLYRCDRCGRLIYFNIRRGWFEYHE